MRIVSMLGDLLRCPGVIDDHYSTAIGITLIHNPKLTLSARDSAKVQILRIQHFVLGVSNSRDNWSAIQILVEWMYLSLCNATTTGE